MNKSLFLVFIIATFTSCGKFFQSIASTNEESDTITGNVEDIPCLYDHVLGHDERDTIVGNFTGFSI